MKAKHVDNATYAENGILAAILCANHGLSGSGSIKECIRNCSASSSSNSLDHVTRFERWLPGPEHLSNCAS
ncbi:hypothetical protein MA16_Dca018506 [Dendrobium catenatum]|uniref:Uncharacterized protein n=1 Tax=Dendrobium catenatum TaxID=906689 RepID=A0A2I0VAF5_9ASPA|nr:hypothetical protein MA16_Dca018506 [Dendrobium catenatum]